jgi:hypothetical protein
MVLPKDGNWEVKEIKSARTKLVSGLEYEADILFSNTDDGSTKEAVVDVYYQPWTTVTRLVKVID